MVKKTKNLLQNTMLISRSRHLYRGREFNANSRDFQAKEFHKAEDLTPTQICLVIPLVLQIYLEEMIEIE
jgi:hypothetical protein